MANVLARSSLVLFVWSLAESTLFFIVPDVLLSLLVLHTKPRFWPFTLGIAVAGAMVGLCGMYIWAANSPAALLWVASVPAISSDMISAMTQTLASGQLYAPVLVAGVTGVPIKVVAVTAPAAGVGLGPFLLAAAMARTARFVLAIAIAALLKRALAHWPIQQVQRLFLAGWVLFYIAFFMRMPN